MLNIHFKYMFCVTFPYSNPYSLDLPCYDERMKIVHIEMEEICMRNKKRNPGILTLIALTCLVLFQ